MGADRTDDEMDELGRTCDALVELSRAHSVALASGDLDLVNRLLDERGRLLSGLNLKNLGAGAGPLSAMQSQLLSQLREVLRIDDENKRVLQTRLKEIRDRIDTMGIGRQVMRRYACIAAKTEPTYIDQRQ